ncbi:hypothetical protein PanWU01x14_320910 [Parasponia andersonii]|uniref:Uncharacterized protein n=1 Tax=Parasponia andersonii TaxID=3476 RepID=A0A2P5ALG5_PARAD|nr:hypothetical protein PanWU01x14_320910 [Parasponia andersonii]
MLARRHAYSSQPLVLLATRATQHVLNLLHSSTAPNKHRDLLPPQHVHERQILDRTVSDHHRHAPQPQSPPDPRHVSLILEQAELTTRSSLRESNLIRRSRFDQEARVGFQLLHQRRLSLSASAVAEVAEKFHSRAGRRVCQRANRGESYVLVRDEIAGGSGEAGDLDRVLPQLEDVPIGIGGPAGAREVHVISAEGTVPVRELPA